MLLLLLHKNTRPLLWSRHDVIAVVLPGLMFRDDLVVEQEEMPAIIVWILGILPTYKDLMSLVPGLIPD